MVNIDGQVPATATATGKVEAQTLAKIGYATIANMTEAEKEALAANSGTLHFKELLGQESKPGSIARTGDKRDASFTPVGAVFVSDIAIEIPQIPVLKNHLTGVEVEDLTYVAVAANVPFVLTLVEAMYLLKDAEYGGFCEYGGDAKGIKLVPKAPNYFKNNQKLPTPTLELSTSGSIKDLMISIDTKTPAGVWEAKEEYKEKFGALYTKKAVTRNAGAAKLSDKIFTPTAVAVALSSILHPRTAAVAKAPAETPAKEKTGKKA